MKIHPLVLALVFSLAAASAADAARHNPLQSMFGDLLDPGAKDRERAGLREVALQTPSDGRAWLEYARFSFANDEPEETITLLREGIAQVEESVELWRILVMVHLHDAESGPQRVHRPGHSRGRKQPSPLAEDAIKTQALEQALIALTAVRELDPNDRDVRLRTGTVLQRLDRWSDAADFWHKSNETLWLPTAAAGHAFSLLQLNRAEEALALAEDALGRAPRHGDLHRVRARILESLGDETGAKEADARGAFYERLMPDATLAYTTELAASLVRLFATKDGQPALFAGDRDNDVIDAEIAVLAGSGNDAAMELLATLAWSHSAHGPQEVRAFAVLGDHGEVARLHRILAHAGSPCTIGGALRQLVRLRVGSVFDHLVALLPRDAGMFPMGIVAMLETLGDPRAGPVLIEHTRTLEAPHFDQALVALGAFDSPAVRAHLESWAKDLEARPFAAAALHRLTGDKKWWKEIVRTLRSSDSFDHWEVAAYVATLPTPEAKKLVANWEKKRERRK